MIPQNVYGVSGTSLEQRMMRISSIVILTFFIGDALQVV